MSRIGTARNLGEGGTYDILLSTFPDGFPQSRVIFEIGVTPRKVTGIQKVAQIFVKTLLTTKGSDPLRPLLGTTFNLDVVNANRGVSLQDLHTVIRSILREAESQTKALLNTTNLEKQSQLESVTLITLRSEGEMLTIYLSLLTKAGAQAQIAVPFPRTDMSVSQ